jgi:hypothetical protein
MKRTAKAQNEARLRRCLGSRRPHLEILESRLMPGDTVFGGRLAYSWLEPQLSILNVHAPDHRDMTLPTAPQRTASGFHMGRARAAAADRWTNVCRRRGGAPGCRWRGQR